ncbi:MAG: trypsin-like peptidase domain-containing protein [Bacteroidales bacterium]|nr:trypsin-like peptidase domain-containing protein [Bacteroidales bacterium]
MMKIMSKELIKVLFISIIFAFLTPVGIQAQTPAKGPVYVDLTTAAERSVNAVVYIKTEFMQKNSAWDEFFGGTIWEHFFGSRPSTYPVQAAGSGVIVTSDGYIVTNNHVVEDAVKVTVTLNDKREYEGTIVGTDPKTDLAVLKINAEGLSYLEFDNSDEVRIGEWVLAVGNPMNLTSTVTAGIISAKARQLALSGRSQTEESYLQTDAAVNSGNSGGALVNASGRLVGINTAIASGNGYYTGYSFAIPSNIVKKIYLDIKEYGQVQQAYIGVSIAELNASLAKEYDLEDVRGVYVAEVDDEGAAAQSGLQAGDVITHIGGTPVNSLAEVRGVLKTKSPGDVVNVSVVRNKEKFNKLVTLLNNKGTKELFEKNPR